MFPNSGEPRSTVCQRDNRPLPADARTLSTHAGRFNPSHSIFTICSALALLFRFCSSQCQFGAIKGWCRTVVYTKVGFRWAGCLRVASGSWNWTQGSASGFCSASQPPCHMPNLPRHWPGPPRKTSRALWRIRRMCSLLIWVNPLFESQKIQTWRPNADATVAPAMVRERPHLIELLLHLVHHAINSREPGLLEFTQKRKQGASWRMGTKTHTCANPSSGILSHHAELEAQGMAWLQISHTSPTSTLRMRCLARRLPPGCNLKP